MLSIWWWKSTEPVRLPVAEPTSENEADALARLEAVLLVAREPLPSRRLAQLAALADGTQARTFCRQLNRRYDARGAAFYVEQVAGGFQLLTRPQYSPWLRRLHRRQVELRLSGPAMETLAIVAYRQPLLRADIESIRGVQCGEILRQLMDRELVRIAGRSEELGRPFYYATTKRFLQAFGLRDLDDLPRANQLRAASERDEPAAPKTDHPSAFPPGGGDDPATPTGNQPEPPVKETDVTQLVTAEPENHLLRPQDEDDRRRLVAADDEDEDLEDDEDLDDDEDDEEEDWDDEEDEDLEDDDWEEVEDEEVEEEEEEDDEDWEDDDEDWDDDEDDEDWDDEDDEEDDDWEEEEGEEEA